MDRLRLRERGGRRHRGVKKKEGIPGILTLLGHAVGCVRLTREEFCLMTPEEYAAVAKAWRDDREASEKTEWERMRLQTAILIQPHVKGRISPKGLLRFPWEEPSEEDPEPMTIEERRRRADAALEEWRKRREQDK